MAQTDAQLHKISRELINRIYVTPNATAIHNHTQVRAAVGLIDTAMNATGNQIVTAGYGTTALKAAMYTEMRKQMPNITPQQAAIALALWALEEAGLL